MKKQMRQVYTADDGTDFLDESECRQHEREVALKEIIKTWTVYDDHIPNVHGLVCAILAWVDKDGEN